MTGASSDPEMTDRRWLDATWPFVRGNLPAAPCRALEIGCGNLGGFVPYLRGDGYDAIGVDPDAPDGPAFHQVEFESYDVTQPVDVVIACTSLHHVDDLDLAVDRIVATLEPEGLFIVVEWAIEAFDEATARWCFDRLPASGDSWLRRHHDAWNESHQPWDEYVRHWSQHEHGLHTWREVESALGLRFVVRDVSIGPYYFPELDASWDDEADAIASGRIRAAGVRYVASLRA